MKKIYANLFFAIAAIVLLFSSCTSLNQTIKEPNSHVQFVKSDYEFSGQFSAEASSTKILGIDFKRIFMKKTASVDGSGGVSAASIPIIGSLVGDRTSGYALYELMQAHTGYDVVFYPQFETKVVKPILGIGLLSKFTTVKVTARLGKVK
ncbi:MAG: hypothetical protein RIS47_1660 [Bacteroidota bacterium]|jgi:hypothetical protein